MWLEQSPWPLLALGAPGFPIVVILFDIQGESDQEASDAGEQTEERELEQDEDKVEEQIEEESSGSATWNWAAAIVAVWVVLGWNYGPWTVRYVGNQAKVSVEAFGTAGVQVILRQEEEEVARLTPKSTQAVLSPGAYEVVVTSKGDNRIDKVSVLKQGAGGGKPLPIFAPPETCMLHLDRGDLATIAIAISRAAEEPNASADAAAGNTPVPQ
jgi:hypothetical protein